MSTPQRIFVLPLHPPGIEAASGDGALWTFPPENAAFELRVTAVNGTLPTLNVIIEEYNAVTGLYRTIATFTEKTAVSDERVLLAQPVQWLGNIRCSWTIGGSASPDFTFSVSAGGKI